MRTSTPLCRTPPAAAHVPARVRYRKQPLRLRCLEDAQARLYTGVSVTILTLVCVTMLLISSGHSDNKMNDRDGFDSSNTPALRDMALGGVHLAASPPQADDDSADYEPKDRVMFVPGFGTPLEKQYAGLVMVNSLAQGQLFYWFFETRDEAKKTSPDTPIIMWLNGGPGASSMTGLMTEMGPYRIMADGKLVSHPQSWTNLGHMIFFDQPVGTGYSSVRDDNGHVSTQEEMAEQLYRALLGFYARHPEYRNNPLYVCGESYAGKYVPYISHYIHQQRQAPTPAPSTNDDSDDMDGFQVNLQGIAIGNGIMWPVLQTRSVPDFAIALGLIDLQEYERANVAISSCEEFHREGRHIDAFRVCQSVEDEHRKLNSSMPTEYGVGHPQIYKVAGIPFVYDVRKEKDEFGALTKVLSSYFNNDDVRRALNVPSGTPWNSVDGSAYGISETAPSLARHLLNDEMLDVPIDVFRDLLDNYQFLFYAGNMDGSSCNNLGISRMIDRLAWKGTVTYRSAPRKPWVVNGRTAGLAKTTGNMSYVVVTNSGHLVPTDQPDAALDMMRRFINGEPFFV
ncbi:TPA: LOW QUALITY PROTEIN: hypothetical protein N0F65_005550 [Lagenidium giganteum]|uniref:Carboxypeptidase n=1 Tax=Lagenidium giganteum TaxID=4803 RepID=A0AAV2YUS6_9STRA|nr:TPA: LOW QUALITY PROTEIN: hypothetical protein N0F65_005550 [Lagenidium giganteum]